MWLQTAILWQPKWWPPFLQPGSSFCRRTSEPGRCRLVYFTPAHPSPSANPPMTSPDSRLVKNTAAVHLCNTVNIAGSAPAPLSKATSIYLASTSSNTSEATRSRPRRPCTVQCLELKVFTVTSSSMDLSILQFEGCGWVQGHRELSFHHYYPRKVKDHFQNGYKQSQHYKLCPYDVHVPPDKILKSHAVGLLIFI